jgi:hypothetical protein
MVHADLSTPSNVLVRDGAVVAVVDIGNAGSGTRATDLTTLVWYTVKIRCWTVSEGGCGRESSTWSAGRGRRSSQRHRSSTCSRSPIRHERHDSVPGVVERGHRALDELNALSSRRSTTADTAVVAMGTRYCGSREDREYRLSIAAAEHGAESAAVATPAGRRAGWDGQ